MRTVLLLLCAAVLAGCAAPSGTLQPAAAEGEAPAGAAPPVAIHHEGTIEAGLGTPRAASVPAIFVGAGRVGGEFRVPEGVGAMRVSLSHSVGAPGGVTLGIGSSGGSYYETGSDFAGSEAEIALDDPAPGTWSFFVHPLGPVASLDWTLDVAFE